LYIFAAFLSLALSFVVATTDESSTLAVGNLSVENLLTNHDTGFCCIEDADAGSIPLVSSDADNRIDEPVRLLVSSGSFRLSVRRVSYIYTVITDNDGNATRNTLHSLICQTHGRNSSGFNEPASYLIRLRKFII